MTKVHKVRREFNEKFSDTVCSFAGMGYSQKSVAHILEINPSWFNQLCIRFDLKKSFLPRKQQLSICKPPGHPKGKVINQPQRFTDNQLLSTLGMHPKDISVLDYNNLQHLPCADTIIKRFGSWRKAKKLVCHFLQVLPANR